MAQARTADYPLMAAAAGFDAVSIDLQHTVTPLETASMLCIAAAGAGLLPLVRVPSHSAEYLSRALDGGARGIIVPHVNSVDDARRIVNVCRFPRVGSRGVVGPSMGEAMTFCEGETVVALMLESPNAIAQADAIAAFPGVDMLLIGAYDLTTEMGIMGEFTHPRFRRAIDTAAAACKVHGKVLGLAGVADLGQLAEFVAAGVRFISAGTDAGLFMGAAIQRAAALQMLAIQITNH